MQAMILAAGLGTRLLPYSGLCPKPLFPILNKPLLLLTIERLQKCGYDHIIVNCHHLRQQIVQAVASLSGVRVIEEEQILGTGGGLQGALPYLRKEPLLVTNGDIYHTVDLKGFYQQHISREEPVTLAMHNYTRFNSVRVAGDRIVDFDRRQGECQQGELLAFTGLHVIDPAILSSIPPGYSCIIEHYRRLLQQGLQFGCVRVDDSFWTDMGTPQDYLDLNEGLLIGKIPRWQELGEQDGDWQVSANCCCDGPLTLERWGALGAARVGKNVVLSGSVVWDGARIPATSRISDSIVAPGMEHMVTGDTAQDA